MFPAAMLINSKTERFHPIVFRPAPRPSESGVDTDTMRYKSKGHHTEGFDTIEQARAWIAGLDHLTHFDICWEWDGEEAPAMVSEFAKRTPVTV